MPLRLASDFSSETQEALFGKMLESSDKGLETYRPTLAKVSSKFVGKINYSTIKIKLLFKTILNDETLEAFQLKPGTRKLKYYHH